MSDRARILVVTGAAMNVLDDISSLAFMLPAIQGDYMAIGLAAVDKYPWPILYMATYHYEDIAPARARREAIGGNTDYKVIHHKPQEGVDLVGEYPHPRSLAGDSGSSALLGCEVALDQLGYAKIVLCGCPLIGIGQHNYEIYRKGWEQQQELVMGRVKSMSGWTREFLGAPTEEWLNG
jgi:hypothetical protein